MCMCVMRYGLRRKYSGVAWCGDAVYRSSVQLVICSLINVVCFAKLVHITHIIPLPTPTVHTSLYPFAYLYTKIHTHKHPYIFSKLMQFNYNID